MDKKIDTIGFQLYDKWLRNFREGKMIKVFFDDNFYYKIAIYGMGLIGMQLFEELKFSNIQVCYAIDQNAQNIYVEGLNIITPECLKYKVQRPETIVVTPMQYYDEIEKMLLKQVKNTDCGVCIAIWIGFGNEKKGSNIHMVLFWKNQLWTDSAVLCDTKIV